MTRLPRHPVLLLGDELLDSGIPPAGSRSATRWDPQTPRLGRRLAVRSSAAERVPDTVAALVAVLTRSVRMSDLVLTTGGTAAGPVDCLHSAIDELGGDLSSTASPCGRAIRWCWPASGPCRCSDCRATRRARSSAWRRSRSR